MFGRGNPDKGRGRRVRIALTLALLGSCLVGRAAWIAVEALKVPRPLVTLPDFKLSDVVTGRTIGRGHFRDQPALIVAIVGVDCPLANLMLPRLSRLADAYRGRGVAVLGLDPNDHDLVEQIAENVRSHALSFPVVKDVGNVLADRLGAERTGEVFLFDAERRLRYQGALDDQDALGAHRASASRRFLVDALEAVLAGRSVAVAETKAIGCPIDRVGPTRVRPASPAIIEALAAHDPIAPGDIGPVTYAGEVAPILRAKCESCHRPGQVAPFSLRTFEQARAHASMIAEVVEQRRMPPWHADPRHGRFENDRSLTPRQRATLLAWVAQGTPPGDLTALPAPRVFPAEWTIGTPDVVLAMPEPFAVPAEGVLPYQRFRVPTGFAEDRWIEAAEIRPGDRTAVHHVIVFLAAGPRGGKLGGHRKGACLASYAPGDLPSVFPPGTAKRIPAGTDLLFEIHYTPTGRPRSDRSAIGLVFSKTPVEHEAVTRGIPDRALRIPPGAARYESRSSWTVPADIHLLSLMPHMHLRGSDFRYTARFPDGRTEVLLSVPAFDFAWQSVYRLTEPKALPKGTRIECLAHFDNSRQNPNNPNPDVTVRWGPYTWDEMMIGYADYYHDDRATTVLPSETTAD